MTESKMRDQGRTSRTMHAGQLPGTEDPSRRSFALGGVAVGVAAIVGGRRAARLTARERPIETVAQGTSVLHAGSKAVVGATVSAGNPGGSTRLEAARIFDQNMGGRKMALAVERVYWGKNKWQTARNKSQEVWSLNQAGIAIVGSFTPAYPPTQEDRRHLTNSLKQLKNQNAIVEAICLTHEPNDGKFPSGHAYKSYIDHYGPVVIEAGYHLAYIPLITKNQDVEAYYPTGTYEGQPMVTRMYGDFYCDSYDKGASLDQLFTVATAKNTPRVGLGEFGKHGSSKNPVPGEKKFDAYCKHLASEFQAWNANGNDSAAIMYFTNGPGNNPTKANYASLEDLWDALSINA
jgi:hypothetical protein